MREGGGQDVYCLREIFFLENKLNSTNIKNFKATNKANKNSKTAK